MGRVNQVIRGRDGLIREATIAYRNHSETFNRMTNRAVRSLVKLFSIDEDCIQEDLAVLQKRIDRMSGQDPVVDVPGQAAQAAEQVQDDDYSERMKTQKMFQVTFSTEGENELELKIMNEENIKKLGIPEKSSCCKQCCCFSHCALANHGTSLWRKAIQFTNPFQECTVCDIVNGSQEYVINDDDDVKLNGDSLTDLLFSVNSIFE